MAEGGNECVLQLEETGEQGRGEGGQDGGTEEKLHVYEKMKMLAAREGEAKGRKEGYKAGRAEGYKAGWNDAISSPPSAQKPR